MLKIESIQTVNSGSTTLRLEGRVIGPWVEEVRQSCESVCSRGARLILDLSDVSFVDRQGIELFRSLQHRQVELRNCSPFVAEQLKA